MKIYDGMRKAHRSIVDFYELKSVNPIVFDEPEIHMDINDPKVRWAQHVADKSGEKQVLIANSLGGVDIKRQSAVNLIFNDKVRAVIEPKSHRIPNKLTGKH